jgi:hypothetical protein
LRPARSQTAALNCLAEGTGGARLASLDVVAGELIQLAILPKVDYSCDTTRVELEIAELQGGSRVWNLEKDATGSTSDEPAARPVRQCDDVELPRPGDHIEPGVRGRLTDFALLRRHGRIARRRRPDERGERRGQSAHRG